MSRSLKIIVITVAVIFALLLSSMVIVPWQVKKQGSHWIAENTDRSLTIEKVYFNPFTLTVEISGTKLTEQNNDQPFVVFKRLMFSISPKSIIKQAVILRRIELDDLFVNIEILGEEEFNFSDFTQLENKDSETDTADESKPLYFSLNNIILTNGSINFTDQTSTDKTQHQIRQLLLNIPVIGNIPYLVENYVEPKLSMLLNDAEVKVTGELKPFKDSHETKLFLNFTGVDLAYYAHHSPVSLPLEVKEGTLDFKINLSYLVSKSAGPKLLLDGKLALSDLDLRGLDERELFRMSSLILDIRQADIFSQDFNISSLEIHDPQVYVDRDRSGSWNFQPILPPQETIAAEQKSVAPEDEKEDSLPRLTIKKLTLTSGQVHYRDDFGPEGHGEYPQTDANPARKDQLKIFELNFQAENLTYPDAVKSPFSLAMKVGKEGDIKVAGSVVINPLQLQAQTDISAFSLPLLNEFLPANVKTSLKSGKFYSTIAVDLKQLPEKLSGDFSGKLHIDDFDLQDPIGDDELLTWGNLDLTGIKGTIAPLSLQIKDVSLSDYVANIQITPEGEVNLFSITAAEAKADDLALESQPVKVEKTVIAKETPPEEPSADIQLSTLTLQGGTVSFVDRHIKKTFSTTMYDLGGQITGLSSAEEIRAKVDLHGQLEKHSPLTIKGEINPLGQDLFADLTISFKDIDLTPLSPYSGTYIGYIIDKGTLYLDLNYHIEGRKLSATNQVMIDQFTLGDTVESDQAMSIPIALAIPILKDSNGEIHLNIPITGDLDDPSFSVGGTVVSVITNGIIKVVTSPLSLISSLIGGDEGFTGITFASGLSTIDTDQLTNLKKLAEILATHPALILEISGFVDKEKDPEAYRQEQLRKNPAGDNSVGEDQLQDLARARARTVREALVAESEEIKSQLFLKKVDIYQLPEDGSASRVEFNITSKK